MHALAFAFMNGAGPAEDCGGAQAIEPCGSVIALVYLEHGKPAAIAVGWQRVELAGAAGRAIAIAELAALDFPSGHGFSSRAVRLP
jgi:hypothetical protein